MEVSGLRCTKSVVPELRETMFRDLLSVVSLVLPVWTGWDEQPITPVRGSGLIRDRLGPANVHMYSQ